MRKVETILTFSVTGIVLLFSGMMLQDVTLCISGVIGIGAAVYNAGM